MYTKATVYNTWLDNC